MVIFEELGKSDIWEEAKGIISEIFSNYIGFIRNDF